MSRPAHVQRLEGLAMVVVGIVAFAATDYSWWWFAGLLLVPDISMAGYLAGPAIGAAVYNAGHTLAIPAALAVWWAAGGPLAAAMAATIWLAHIGMDRAMGYGLKFDSGFTHTHLGEIGGRGGAPDR